MPASSMIITAPVRRDGSGCENTVRTVSSGRAVRHCESGRIASSTRINCLPRLPPG